MDTSKITNSTVKDAIEALQENNGKDFSGNFFAGQWGTFKVFFKFHLNSDQKFNKLEIGQF